jgi:hypothetical protein
LTIRCAGTVQADRLRAALGVGHVEARNLVIEAAWVPHALHELGLKGAGPLTADLAGFLRETGLRISVR